MKRKLLTLILLLATVFGLVAIANTQDVEAASGIATLKLDASTWGSASAYYSIHYWGGESSTSWPGNKFNNGKAASGSVEITANYDPTSTHCIIIRWGNSGYSQEWNRWNYFDGKTMPQQYNYFTNNGWTSCTYKYIEPEAPKYSVKYHDSEGKVNKEVEIIEGGELLPIFIEKEGYTLEGWYTDSALTKKIEKGAAVTSNLNLYPKYVEASDYSLYFSDNGTLGDTVYAYMWSDVYGHTNNWPGEVITKDSRGNYVVNVTASKGFDRIIFNNNKGTQTVDLNLSSSMDGDTYVLGSKTYDKYSAELNETTAKYEMKDLLTAYYNNGSYTKDTTIFVDAAKVNADAKKYFHAGCSDLVRKTVYTNGKLVMTTDSQKAGAGYKDVDGNMVRFHVDGENEVIDFTVNGTSVEEYYVTLHDFLQDSSTSNYGTFDLAAGWTYENGIYSNTSSDVLTAFRLFVAPMWIQTGANYITFTNATIEVVDGSLVMKLWVDQLNVGLFPEGYTTKDAAGNYLFAQAIIK